MPGDNIWILESLGNWKGTGKDRDPNQDKRKGKERNAFHFSAGGSERTAFQKKWTG